MPGFEYTAVIRCAWADVRVAVHQGYRREGYGCAGFGGESVIDEGGSYDLGDVRIEGAPHFEPVRLLKTGKFKTGDLADFDEIGKGVDRIKKVLAHQGYMRNDVKIERKIDDAKKTVNLVLHIDEGPQFLFGTLSIEGLDLNGESALRKMWTHKPDTPYNPEYPDLLSAPGAR